MAVKFGLIVTVGGGGMLGPTFGPKVGPKVELLVRHSEAGNHLIINRISPVFARVVAFINIKSSDGVKNYSDQ